MKSSKPAKPKPSKTPEEMYAASPLVAIAKGAAAGFWAAAGDFDKSARILPSNQSGPKKGRTPR